MVRSFTHLCQNCSHMPFGDVGCEHIRHGIAEDQEGFIACRQLPKRIWTPIMMLETVRIGFLSHAIFSQVFRITNSDGAVRHLPATSVLAPSSDVAGLVAPFDATSAAPLIILNTH